MNENINSTPQEILTLARNAARKDNAIGVSKLFKREKSTPYEYPLAVEDRTETHIVWKENVLLALMVGSRRCGKTTLMVSIVKEFKSVLGIDFRIEPVNAHTRDTFLKMEKELSDFACSPTYVSGIKPNESIETYEFLLYCKQHPRNVFLLRFIDVPGEWVRQYPEAMQALIDSADILYFTVNTPALLENDGIYSDEINAPENVLNVAKILCEPSTKLKQRLMLFVPTKCEKYYWRGIDHGADYEMLRVTNAINAMYEPLLAQIRNNEALKKRLTIATIPVMTIGGVTFSLFRREEKDGVSSLIESYVLTNDHNDGLNGYRPRLCEQPMLYSMRFFCELARKRIQKGRLSGFISDARAHGVKKAFTFAFHDPLYERLKQVTHLANFENFAGMNDFRETESRNGVPPRALPSGVYVNIDALGIRILNDPNSLFGAKPPLDAKVLQTE